MVSSRAGRWLPVWFRWRLMVTQEAGSGNQICEGAGWRVVEELVDRKGLVTLKRRKAGLKRW